MHAAVLPRGIPMISLWTGNPVAAETPARVLAHVVRVSADAARRALVDVLTRSTVDTESVAVGTLARVAARRVLANADAEIVVLEFSALVDVAARSIIGVQPETRLASASVAAPNVQTYLLTESWCTLALVDVMASTGTVSPDVLVALIAQTLVRADGVFTAAIRAADTVAVDAALVDVDAIVVGSGRVAGRTNAVVPAAPVLAGLTLATLVRSLLTFVHVYAELARRVHGVAWPADHSGRASVGAESVQAHLHGPAARIRRSLTLVYVHALAAGAWLEAALAIRPGIRRKRFRCCS